MQFALQDSSATPDFKDAIVRFEDGNPTDRVKVESYAPRVKVRRVLVQLLKAEPRLEIEQVVIRGRSGCSDFIGSVDVQTRTGPQRFDFVWCCRWRAEAEGYVDYFGFPDQSRAAQEFDWDCFQEWARNERPY